MHMPGLVPIIIIGLLALLLFGRPGRLSNLMEDLGKGIRGFRKGLTDPNEKKADEPPPQVTADQRREGDRTGA
jgi:sec-independent protein translocase protein TatA